MLLIEGSNIKKYFGDRLILDIDNLKIYSGDRIGIVGANGVGKTTLINILTKKFEPDEGLIKVYETCAYISQLEEPDSKKISNEMASKFRVAAIWNENMSGGEKTRFKLARSLEFSSSLIFADEPTSNMDIEGIEYMEKKFKEYKGALIIISHDRSFLDKLCNKVWEIEHGMIKIYNGNYSDYGLQKTQERERAEFEYAEYVKEKDRLKNVIIDTKQKSKNVKKTPKRMGNSEARLHKMGDQRSKVNIDGVVKNVKKRIEHLQIKEKPNKQQDIKLNIPDSNKLYGKIIIEGKNIIEYLEKNPYLIMLNSKYITNQRQL